MQKFIIIEAQIRHYYLLQNMQKVKKKYKQTKNTDQRKYTNPYSLNKSFWGPYLSDPRIDFVPNAWGSTMLSIWFRVVRPGMKRYFNKFSIDRLVLKYTNQPEGFSQEIDFPERLFKLDGWSDTRLVRYYYLFGQLGSAIFSVVLNRKIEVLNNSRKRKYPL